MASWLHSNDNPGTISNTRVSRFASRNNVQGAQATRIKDQETLIRCVISTSHIIFEGSVMPTAETEFDIINRPAGSSLLLIPFRSCVEKT